MATIKDLLFGKWRTEGQGRDRVYLDCVAYYAVPLTAASFAGVTTENTLLDSANKIHPDLYTNSLPDLLKIKSEVGKA